jgi:hypothetical protein
MTQLWQWFLLLKVHLKGKGSQSCKHSRMKKAFWRSLSAEECLRCCRQIPWLSLLSLPESPWQKLFASQVDKAFITMTGFDHNSFTTLLQKCALVFDDYTPFNKRQIELKEDPKKKVHQGHEHDTHHLALNSVLLALQGHFFATKRSLSLHCQMALLTLHSHLLATKSMLYLPCLSVSRLLRHHHPHYILK